MTKVMIDGIEYVPKVSIEPITDERVRRALESLTEILYFHECTHKHRAWAFDAVTELAPDLARLAADDPEAAFNLVHGEED